eukprot:m.68103 g.68103  ORF g.68103 m.68103 type:complete len:93 (+) comp35490_c0_seq1:2858-3136(+)
MERFCTTKWEKIKRQRKSFRSGTLRTTINKVSVGSDQKVTKTVERVEKSPSMTKESLYLKEFSFTDEMIQNILTVKESRLLQDISITEECAV